MMDIKDKLEIYQEGLYLVNHVKEAEQVKAELLESKSGIEKQLAVDVPKEPLPEKPILKKNSAKYIVTTLIGIACGFGFMAGNDYYLEPNHILDKGIDYMANTYSIDLLKLIYVVIASLTILALIIEGISSHKKSKLYKQELASWELKCEAIESRNKIALNEDMQEKEKLSNEAKLLELKLESLDTTIRLSNKRYQEKVLPLIEETNPTPGQLQDKINDLKAIIEEGLSFDTPETTDVSDTEEIPIIKEEDIPVTLQEPFEDNEPTFNVKEDDSMTSPEPIEDESNDSETFRDPFAGIIDEPETEQEQSEDATEETSFTYDPADNEGQGLMIDESTPLEPTEPTVDDMVQDPYEMIEDPEEEQPQLFEGEDDSILMFSDVMGNNDEESVEDSEQDESEIGTEEGESEPIPVDEIPEFPEPIEETVVEEVSEEGVETEEPSESVEEQESISEEDNGIEIDLTETPVTEVSDDILSEAIPSEEVSEEIAQPVEEALASSEEIATTNVEATAPVVEEVAEDIALEESTSKEEPVKEVSEKREICQRDVQEVSKECTEECAVEVTEPSADLIKQNKEEGYADGVSLEKLSTVKRGWKLGMDIKVVAALTDLSEDKVEKIYELFAL